MTLYPAGMEPQQINVVPRRSAWPTVIGVISIVIASLYIICTPLGLVFKDFAGSINPKQAEMTAKMMADMPPWYHAYQVASCVVYEMIYILLLVAGILLARRRLAAARIMHILYALLNILMVVVGGVLLVRLNQVLTESVPPAMQSVLQASMIFGAIFGFALASAYPVFLLVWYSRGKIRQEIDTWKAARGQF